MMHAGHQHVEGTRQIQQEERRKKTPKSEKKNGLEGCEGPYIVRFRDTSCFGIQFSGGGTGGKENEQTQPFLRLPKTP